MWDNHLVHKRPVLHKLIAARRATLVPQPHYSPEFNTSEPMWSKAEHAVKRACVDTQDTLLDALDAAVGELTRDDLAGWLRHCGYRLNPTA